MRGVSPRELSMLTDEPSQILAAARRVLAGEPRPSLGPGYSERVVETPWVASHFKGGEKVIDVGFTMSSLDYLGLLLELTEHHRVTIEAVDIVKPERVARRYPAAWLLKGVVRPKHKPGGPQAG